MRKNGGGRQQRLEMGRSGRVVRTWCKSDQSEGKSEGKSGGNSPIYCAVQGRLAGLSESIGANVSHQEALCLPGISLL